MERTHPACGSRASLLALFCAAAGKDAGAPQAGCLRYKQERLIMTVKAIPDGYHTATPYLIISGATEAIEYYKQAFGATELFRMPAPGGKIGHAEIKIGDSPIMLADEFPEMGYKSPQTLGGSPVSIMIYVADVDTVFDRAIAAGGKAQRPVKDQFYGDRSGTLEDPFGHVWHVATHKEDVSAEEMERRGAQAAAAASGGES
jgi:PhnB protein